MTKGQRIIIGVGVIIVAAMCVFPPAKVKQGTLRSGRITIERAERSYSPIWSLDGEIETVRLAVQILAVAIATGGLAVVLKNVSVSRRVAVIVLLASASVAAVVVLGTAIYWNWSEQEAKRQEQEAERRRLLTPGELAKLWVRLEEVRHIGDHLPDTSVTMKISNGTRRQIDEVQFTLFIRKKSPESPRTRPADSAQSIEEAIFGPEAEAELEATRKAIAAWSSQTWEPAEGTADAYPLPWQNVRLPWKDGQCPIPPKKSGVATVNLSRHFPEGMHPGTHAWRLVLTGAKEVRE